MCAIHDMWWIKTDVYKIYCTFLKKRANHSNAEIKNYLYVPHVIFLLKVSQKLATKSAFLSTKYAHIH